jgi:arsenite/tail-anchored protein-transporting ATPase
MKLVMFGGKGGVGKTTCASSSGLYFASRGEKTLVICTDPAHSLGDSLGQKLSGKITEIKSVPNLSALEVNADNELDAFKGEYGDEIKKLMDTATNLDKEDIESMFELPIPGMDELMGFKTIVDLIEENRFDKYVVDTAPTGHALKLLASPHLIDDWIKVMAKMRWKYRFMVKKFSGIYKPDKSDDFLMNLKKMVKRIENLLKNENLCEFIPVTIPEAMPVVETERLIKDLKKFGIRVKKIAVNNVLESEGCQFCRDRKAQQHVYIDQIKNKFSNVEIVKIPLQNKEVRGLEALNNIKGLIFG